MSRRKNLINNIIYMGLTMVALAVAIYVCQSRYVVDLGGALIRFLVGAIIAALTATFAHELGHVIGGKKAGFAFSEMVVWFFKWKREQGGIRFYFTLFGSEAGYTEMIPKSQENLDKRLKKMTNSALIASFTMILIGLIPMFLTSLSLWGYCLLVAFLPVGIYSFFGNALPMINEGFLNDGAIVSAIKKGDDSIKVLISLLCIQAQLYQGKTYAEIDKKYYYDLPQLPEDDPNFIRLLNARYNYALDNDNLDEAKTILARMMGLIDDMPKVFEWQIKCDALYAASTYDFDEDKADELMYELEKQLNKRNGVSEIRLKLAYVLNVKKETEPLDMFYSKGVKEADRCQIKGIGRFEKKLLDELVDKNK